MNNNIELSAISRDKVLARLGYAKGKTVADAKTGSIITEELDAARKLIVPKHVTAFSGIVFPDASSVLLEPGFCIQSADIRKLLDGCSKACGFAVTIGRFLEDKRNNYIKENQATRALVLDAIGSVAVEELAESINKDIAGEAAKDGLKATRRFSPGYGDWKLEGQKDFLQWLGAAAAGIKLSETFQMIPEKSVSAILGIK